jgi:hypothetical protein
VSADSSRKRGNSRNGVNFKRGAILLLFPKRPSRIWNVIFYGDLGSRSSHRYRTLMSTARRRSASRNLLVVNRRLGGRYPRETGPELLNCCAAQFRKRLERLATIMNGQRQQRLALDLVLRG